VVLSELFQESFNYKEFQQEDIFGFVYWIVMIFGKNVHYIVTYKTIKIPSSSELCFA
jgi:hypothetical protein